MSFSYLHFNTVLNSEQSSEVEKLYFCTSEDVMLFFMNLLTFQENTSDPEASQDQFDLGNDTVARGPDEAMNKFLDREFPEVRDVTKGESHQLIFVPDSFIYGDLTEKVRCSTTGNARFILEATLHFL